MGRAAGEVHPPIADFDEEQHVQSLPNRVDGKEIDGDEAFGLRLKELTPRWTRPSTRRTQQCPAGTPSPFSSPRCADSPTEDSRARSAESALEPRGSSARG
jgi:hypothetical protein